MDDKPGNPMQDLLRRQLGIDAFALDGDARDQPEAWTDNPNAAHSARAEKVQPIALKPLERRWPSIEPPRRN